MGEAVKLTKLQLAGINAMLEARKALEADIAEAFREAGLDPNKRYDALSDGTFVEVDEPTPSEG